MATKKRKPVIIGARWSPGQRSHRGTNGSFAAVNEWDLGRDAMLVQRDLLRPANPKANSPMRFRSVAAPVA